MVSLGDHKGSSSPSSAHESQKGSSIPRHVRQQLSVGVSPSPSSSPLSSSGSGSNLSIIGKQGDGLLSSAKLCSMGSPRSGGLIEVKNDYSQHYLNTKQRPQNFIRDVTVEEGFAEYPKLATLLAAKDEMVNARQTPPTYMQVDLKSFDIRSLGSKFDVIYIDPPWEEYARRAAAFAVGRPASAVWTVEELEALPIGEISDTPSFIFLWCGSGGRITESPEGGLHVNDGRRLLKKWGYRRSEDICWLKTNKQGTQDTLTSTTSLLARTKEHCLMGIKGSVRRNRDGHLIHANIHTDVMVAEQHSDPLSTEKPEEIYKIMEHFCLGRRRLELFGCPRTIRPGWVTLGNEIEVSNYDPATFNALMTEPGKNPDGSLCEGHLLGSTQLIEDLRPKTPPRERDSLSTQGPVGGGAQGPMSPSFSSSPFGSCMMSPRGGGGGGPSRRGRGGGRGLRITAPKPQQPVYGFHPRGSPHPSSPPFSPSGSDGGGSYPYSDSYFYWEEEVYLYPQQNVIDGQGSFAAAESAFHSSNGSDSHQYTMRKAFLESGATVTGSFLAYSEPRSDTTWQTGHPSPSARSPPPFSPKGMGSNGGGRPPFYQGRGRGGGRFRGGGY